MSDLCVECGDTVRPLQHALACDVCDKWQHRTCGTEKQCEENLGQKQPFLEGPPPYPTHQEYPHQTGYVYPSQQGFVNPPPPHCVIQGQPPYQGYVVQLPPSANGMPVQQHAQVITIAPQQPRHDLMLAAILVTLCCFFPTGIIAIMRASEARAAAMYGDMPTAERHNKSAKRLIKISIIAGVITTALFIALVVVYLNLLNRVAGQHHY